MTDLLTASRQVRKEFGGLVADERHRLHHPAGLDRLADRARTAPARRPSSTCSPGSTGRRRARSSSTARDVTGEAAACDHRARGRPHLPEHPALPAHDRARERPRRDALPAQGRHLRLDPAHPARAPRGARGRARAHASCCASRAFAAATTRWRATSPTATSAGSRSRERSRRSRSSLLLDEPTAGMNPQETAAFTAFVRELRDERESDDPDDRARHEGRDGHLRPRHRARLRREDRRGHAAARSRRTSA